MQAIMRVWRKREMVARKIRRTRLAQKLMAALMCGALLAPAPIALAQPAAADNDSFVIKITSDLVLVSVTARDKRGNLLRGLKATDFTLLEDGKAQQVESFDTEDTDQFTPPPTAPSQSELTPSTALLTGKTTVSHEAVRDRRLIVLFLDLSSLEADDSDRAVESARNFVNRQMTSADLISVVTFSTSLKVVQDFTADKKRLLAALDRISGIESSGFDQGTTGSSEGTADDAGSFVADDSDYNAFNTDLRLQALSKLAKSLSGLDQKKSILYFSSGMTKTGIENQAQLRAAINNAIRSNVAIYAVDSRGLQAMPPGGTSDTASLRGTSSYSGAAVQNDLDSNFSSQETLVTIANDTGGKAFLDSNDFSKAYAKVQADSESYYVLGYRSSNAAQDGRFRHIQVRLNRKDVKLEYRQGYYGPRDFQHSNKQDREEQLQAELNSDLPATDLPVYLSTGYFRMQDGRFYVPISLVVPSSALTVQREKDRASLDVLGIVREKQSRFPLGNVRDTVQLSVEQTRSVATATPTNAAAATPSATSAANSAPSVKRKNVQYNTSFLLSPGQYHLKFVVRENQDGRTGAFETDLVIPDLRKEKIKLSSVLLSSQRAPEGKKKSDSPLMSDGQVLIPNVAHVFSAEQPMTLYYEVYDPVAAKKNAIHLLTSISFFRGKVKVYETPVVEATSLNDAARRAATFQFSLPTKTLAPGWYTCQVNVIDDAGATFAFPRTEVLVRP